jgi:nucleoside-diphosphate-sugar epimerase
MKVFVTGASGYLGGSIAARLLEQGHEVLGLVRSHEKAAILASLGIEPLFGTLDDAELLQGAVARTDATVNAANSDHFFSAQAIVNAMKGTGKTLIHTSGSSIICDDAMGAFAGEVVYEDDTPFTPMPHRYPRVAIDRMVRAAGVADGMRALVICPTLVYGVGLGMEPESDQLPKIVARSTLEGAGIYLGEGRNVWSNVYIGDLAALYALALAAAPSGAFLFAENGEASMRDVAEAVSLALGFGGATRSWNIDDALAELGGFGRVALATNARVRAVHARRLLGWSPTGPALADALKNGV